MAIQDDIAYNESWKLHRMKFIYGSDCMKGAKFNFKRLLITVFVLYAGVTLINQQVTIGKLTKVQNEKMQQIESIKRENAKLTKEVETANTDAYKEKMAREQLGLVKPGEVIYINQSEAKDNSKNGDN